MRIRWWAKHITTMAVEMMQCDSIIDRIDPLSDDIEISDYVKKLPLEARKRYAVKLLYNYGRCMLPDPYFIKSTWNDDPSLWPHIEFGHVYCYLIDTPGIFTKESLKAYKSLDAYRFVVSGHVHTVEYNGIGDDVPFCAVRAKVTPSQRVTEKPHRPWAYLDKRDASVYCAHCTCMAGLGEVCSHVAALLFKMEIGVKLGLTSVSSTSEICKWNQTFRKQIEPVTIEELQPLLKGSRNKPVPSVVPSGKDELPDKAILESLKSVCPDAVFFSTIPPIDPEETETASEDGLHGQHVQPLRDLYKENQNKSMSPELLSKIWDNYKCSEVQVKELEAETRGQAVCPTWFEQRKGRITASKAHDILVRRENTSPDNLVRIITGSKCYKLSDKKAVKWGVSNEDNARAAYVDNEKNRHKHLSVSNVGLLIDSKKPFLAVSSDGLVKCDCCSNRLLEIKCPYKHKDKLVKEINDKDFCLDKNGLLKPSHRYYSQVQMQMSVYGLDQCDFFIFTNKDHVTVSVQKDTDFCDKLVKKCENFFFKYILPELVSRKLEHSNNTSEEDKNISEGDKKKENVNIWCLCKEPEYGRMIECANDDCPTQWFHYECVNIRRCPKGKWICPECSDV